MSGYDVIVTGGGPGGSTAAWQLARCGLRTLVLDAARFPRVKLCAGWVTRSCLADLDLDPSDYPETIQPFSRATLEMDGTSCVTDWDHPVSYGIVRREFDDFLLRRAQEAGAEVRDGTRVTSVVRQGDAFRVETPEESLPAAALVGAGGFHCPVSRAFGEVSGDEMVVITRESETRIGRELGDLAPRPGVPELFPEPDLKGYAWYFPKGEFLNIGIGTVTDGRDLKRRHERFLERLRSTGRLPEAIDLTPFRGHAYTVRVRAPRRVAGDGFFLVGDAAGLARGVSGEGIGPAVASGRIAARAAVELLERHRPTTEVAAEYRHEIERRFGTGEPGWLGQWAGRLPRAVLERIGWFVCRNGLLRRRFVFEGAFGMG